MWVIFQLPCLASCDIIPPNPVGVPALLWTRRKPNNHEFYEKDWPEVSFVKERNVCPLIEVKCPTPEVPQIGGLVNLLEEMLEQCQTEARYCVDRVDVMVLLAKRDALSEALQRVKNGRGNPHWSRQRPSVVA
jgi:hypothetical protein